MIPEETLSYLGQILKHLGSPTRLPPRIAIMFPSETKVPTPPFTRYVFNRLVDTDLTYNLISTSPQDEAKIISLLAAHNINITFEDKP
jgi:hypothetical protein